MTDRELLLMALGALSLAVEPKKGKVYAFEFQPIDCAAMHLKAIEALRAKLAQPEPILSGGSGSTHFIHLHNGWRFLKKDEPVIEPKREWVGLTEREAGAIMEEQDAYGTRLYEFANAIEAKLKEKNT